MWLGGLLIIGNDSHPFTPQEESCSQPGEGRPLPARTIGRASLACGKVYGDPGYSVLPSRDCYQERQESPSLTPRVTTPKLNIFVK